MRDSGIGPRISIQLFVKYLGVLQILACLPLVNELRMHGISIGVVFSFLESMKDSYMSVFFMIILPAIATEHSSILTTHNRGWKKVLLLIFNMTTQISKQILY